VTIDAAGLPRRRQSNPRGQGERLREEIIEAASALVAEAGGARQLSLRGVARRVGIATTSVYPHFPDVDHLKVAVVERGFIELDRRRAAAEEGAENSATALLARWRAYAHFALDHPGHYRLMFGPDLPPQLAFDGERSPGRASFYAAVEGIAQCQREGTARRSDEAFYLATLVWPAVHGLVSLRIDRPNFPWPPLDGMLDETLTRLLGLRLSASDSTRSADESGAS